MELRHLRYFVAVAEELNFTRAAARLHIGQSPLSRQIKDLEDELGFALLRRLPHGAELTAAGRAFLGEARLVLTATEQATLSAARAFRGERGNLRLGFTGSATYNPRVTDIIWSFKQAHPEITVDLVEANTAILLDLMHDGSVDAAFLRPGPADRHRPQMLSIDDEPLWAVLPRCHRLAGSPEIDLVDLAGDPLVLFPRSVGPNLYDRVVRICTEAGFQPTFGQEAPQIGSVVNLVAAGFGFAIVPECIRQIRVANVVHLPLAGRRPSTRLSFAWRRDERSPVVLNLLATARNALSDGLRTSRSLPWSR